jgi:hypothetical protein
MAKQLSIIITCGVLALLISGLFFLRTLKGEIIMDETKTVFIKKGPEGYQLFRNGHPFYIRGAAGDSHLEELAAGSGNTVRLYDTLNLRNILDEAEKYNLAVIVDIPIPRYNKYEDPYKDSKANTKLKQTVRELVKKYRDHPALLMWNLGNEVKYPLVLWGNDFIDTFNDMIDMIHREDPNHPVATTVEFLSKRQVLGIYWHSPQLDLLSYNAFGNLKNLEHDMEQKAFWLGSHPYYISEWGSDGPWEREETTWGTPLEPTSSNKRQQLRDRYKVIKEKGKGECLGSLVFFWGDKQEGTHTWFSLFKEGSKSEMIQELDHLWKEDRSVPSTIGLDYILLDKQGAPSNIVVAPNEIKTAEIRYTSPMQDSLRIKWEIYPDTWYYNSYDKQVKPQKTPTSFISSKDGTTSFITPKTEGPYRLFVYIYDQNGYFASANIPFYVLGTK